MLDQLSVEFADAGGLPLSVIVVRTAGAAVLSGAIGLEREIRKNTAGLRTHMLIGVAAAIFSLISLEVMLLAENGTDALRLDPLRLVEAVTGGVAFLAAGMVVYTQGSVKGLTTGAGMWLSSGVGLACGLGYWTIAVVACVAGIVLIALLRHLEFAVGVKE